MNFEDNKYVRKHYRSSTVSVIWNLIFHFLLFYSVLYCTFSKKCVCLDIPCATISNSIITSDHNEDYFMPIFHFGANTIVWILIIYLFSIMNFSDLAHLCFHTILPYIVWHISNCRDLWILWKLCTAIPRYHHQQRHHLGIFHKPQTESLMRLTLWMIIVS